MIATPAGHASPRLGVAGRGRIAVYGARPGAADAELVFSAVSIWEAAIKHSLGRPDFHVDPRVLRRGLLDNGYLELSITGMHAVAVTQLPWLHKDPFDRLPVAQAVREGLVLLTADATMAQYGSPVRLI